MAIVPAGNVYLIFDPVGKTIGTCFRAGANPMTCAPDSQPGMATVNLPEASVGPFVATLGLTAGNDDVAKTLAALAGG